TSNVCGPAVCGNGIRDVGEQCDGGAYCTATCTLPSIAPGCCQDGRPGCQDASGFVLNFDMMQFCQSQGWTTNVPGGVCSQAGTCDILPLQPVPFCCEPGLNPCFSATPSSTADIWHFVNGCTGPSVSHTTPAATCGPAGTCVPG